MLSFVKRRWLLRLLLLVLLIAVGSWATLETFADTPRLSVKSGFYEENFFLKISSLNADAIYYTLDGSTPDENGILYTGPIQISDATQNENVYSMRDDLSAGLCYDLMEKYSSIGSGYQLPTYLIDKCTILRAVAVNNGIVSEEVSATYFVGIQPERYLGCNVISVITDPDNLFDPETGIYVTGNKMDAYIAAGRIHQYWNWWDANYTQRGIEWEREALFQIFDSQGNQVLSKLGGIRTHGGFTRAALPRSLNLYTREKYDGQEKFDLDLFGTGYKPKRVTLASGGNQALNQFPDYMMTQMTRELNFATLLFEPYVLFLDGEYWGFYWLTEKFDEKYVQHYYDVPEDQVVMIKNGALECGTEEDIVLYQQMLDFFANTDLSVDSNYNKACELIDIDSFIDYYATMIYIARNSDWPHANFALWRSRDKEGQNYGDGKWRWMLFDCNSSCMRADAGLIGHDTLNYVYEREPLFQSLWDNENFRTAFRERIFYIADHCFNEEQMDSFIEDYRVTMEPIMAMSWARFYNTTSWTGDNYHAMMDSYKQFFLGRRATVESWF